MPNYRLAKEYDVAAQEAFAYNNYAKMLYCFAESLYYEHFDDDDDFNLPDPIRNEDLAQSKSRLERLKPKARDHETKELYHLLETMMENIVANPQVDQQELMHLITLTTKRGLLLDTKINLQASKDTTRSSRKMPFGVSTSSAGAASRSPLRAPTNAVPRSNVGSHIPAPLNLMQEAIASYQGVQQQEIPELASISISLNDSQQTREAKQQKFLHSKQNFKEIIYLFWKGLYEEFRNVIPTNLAFVDFLGPGLKEVNEIVRLGVGSSLHSLKLNRAIDNQTFRLLEYLDQQFRKIASLNPNEMEQFIVSLEELKSLAKRRAHALQAPEASGAAIPTSQLSHKESSITLNQSTAPASTRTSNESTGIFGRFFSTAGEVLAKLSFGASLGLAVGLILMASGVFALVGATLLLAMGIGAAVTLAVTEVRAYRQEKRMEEMVKEVMIKNPIRAMDFEESEDRDVNFHSNFNNDTHATHVGAAAADEMVEQSSYAQIAHLSVDQGAAASSTAVKELENEEEQQVRSGTHLSSAVAHLSPAAAPSSNHESGEDGSALHNGSPLNR